MTDYFFAAFEKVKVVFQMIFEMRQIFGQIKDDDVKWEADVH